MSPTHSVISGVVTRTCRRHDSNTASNLLSTFSMIPWAGHFGKYHIPTSLRKLQPVCDTAWRKKAGLDQLTLAIYGLLKSHSVTDIIPLIDQKVPIETFTAQQEATKVMYKVRRCIFNVNHLQSVDFSMHLARLSMSSQTNSMIDQEDSRFSCEIDSVDIDPLICQKKTDLQFCLRFPQHQNNVTTKVVKTLRSANKRIKTPERGKVSMAALLKGSLTIGTSVSADLFDYKTDVAHQYKEASDNGGEND